MASIDSIKASDGSGNASVATVQNARSAGATTLIVDTVQGINTNFHATMGTPHTFTDPVTGETITIISEATAVDFKGHVDGSNLEIDTIAPGYTDGGSEVGDIIIIKPTTQGQNEVADIFEVSHNDDGTIKETSVYSAIEEKGVKGADHIYTASDTWTKPANLKFVVVEVQGGGGAGGGNSATAAGQYSSGSGGGGGVYARKKILAADLAASETVTIGAGGTGVSGAGGNAGGNSSFGSHCSANGGAGGSRRAVTTGGFIEAGAAAVTTGVGDLVIPGQPGGAALSFTGGVNQNVALGGSGGSSPFGSSGRGIAANSGGAAALGYGAGGAGSARSESQGASAGGNGSPGIVIVHEYY